MIKKIIIVLFLLSMINIVNAETDNITVSQDSLLDYSQANLGVTLSKQNFSLIYVNLTFYNYLSWMKFSRPTGSQFVFNGSSTIYSRFTCNENCIGGGSIRSEVQPDGRINITWVFDTDTTFQNSPINLTYEDSEAVFNITFQSNTICGQNVAGHEAFTYQAEPAYFYCDASAASNSHALGGVYRTQMETRTTNTYNISYVDIGGEHFFLASGTKQNIPTRHNYTNDNGVLLLVNPSNASFSNTGYINSIGQYNNKLWLNVSLSTGAWTKILINSTSFVSSTESFNISFNKSSYNLNDDVSFNVNISNFDNNSNYFVNFNHEMDGYGLITTTYPITKSNNTIIPSLDKTKKGIIYSQLFKNGVSVLVTNSILYGKNINITNIVGNLTLNKNQYTLYENVNIKYNSSVSGKINIVCNEEIFTQDIYAGYNQQLNYTISKLELFPCNVRLQYAISDSLYEWITLDFKTYETISSIDNVFFSKNYISLGESIDVYYNTMGDRILMLKDSSNNIKFNYTLYGVSQYGLYKSYLLVSTDVTGNYTAYLNYTNNTIIATATIKVMDAIIVSPTTTVNQTYSLLDLLSDGSLAIIGDFERNTNGDITDNGIKKKGDKILPIVLLMCLIILVSGTWNKYKGK